MSLELVMEEATTTAVRLREPVHSECSASLVRSSTQVTRATCWSMLQTEDSEIG